MASRLTAAAFSALVGFGSGHKLLEAEAGGTFETTQFAGLGASAGGLVLAFGGQKVGLVLLYGGIAVFAGSRIWEVVDVIVRPTGLALRVTF